MIETVNRTTERLEGQNTDFDSKVHSKEAQQRTLRKRKEYIGEVPVRLENGQVKMTPLTRDDFLKLVKKSLREADEGKVIPVDVVFERLQQEYAL